MLFLKMVFVTRRKTQRGDCNRGTAGFAYVGGACVVNKRLEKVIENLLQDLLMIFVNRLTVWRSWRTLGASPASSLQRTNLGICMFCQDSILHIPIFSLSHALSYLPRLGAVHDGSPPPSYLGGPGAVKCSWEDGFIMSDLRHTSKGFKWSLCTVRQFQHFLK